MAYTLTFVANLGSGEVGLVLEAQLIDTTGAPVGAPVGGFVEIGDGNYMVTLTAIPDGHRGALKIQKSGGGALQATAPVNPEEGENLDAKTSTRSSHTVANVWDEIIESTPNFTARELFRLISAATAGTASGLGTATAKYFAVGKPTVARIEMVTTVDGDRSGPTYIVT